MAYPTSEQLISYNRSHESLSPQGFVIHSTDTPNATAQNEHDYFNSGDRQASVHYFADYQSIIRCIPENEVCWGCGYTGNHKYIQVEMCEFDDENKFQEVWNRTVWLVADACSRYKNSDGKNWNTNDNVWSHRGISGLYHETNHTDPIQYLTKHGKTWDELLQAIDAKIIELQTPISQPSPQPTPTPSNSFQGTSIIGKSEVSVNQLEQFIHNQNLNAPFLAQIYFNLEQIYGVRADIAFCQMCKETSFQNFGGDVKAEQHNPAGLGATGGVSGNSFDSWEQGIEAQIQHLFAYVCDKELPQGRTLYDQRFKYVTRNTAQFVEYLGIKENPLGKGWATDANYGYGILKLVDEVKQISVTPIEEKYVVPTGNNITPLNGGYGWIESLADQKRVIIHSDKYTYISIGDTGIYAYTKGKDAVKII